MIQNVNRQVSVWRGNSTPPTNYHIWIKENSTIWYYKNGWTLLTASDDSYQEIMNKIKELDGKFDNYYTKEESNKKFLTEETDPTVPLWAKQPNKPTYKTSELNNDLGFITKNAVPSKTSQLKNDSGFITAKDLPTKVSQLTNDKNYVTAKELPTKTSQLTNDSGYITSSDLPTKVSELINDKQYITEDEAKKLLNSVDAYTKEETDKLIDDKIDELKGGIPALVEESVDTLLDAKLPDAVEYAVNEIIEDTVEHIIEVKELVTKDDLATKADINSPTFTGVPSVPTAALDASEKDDTKNQIANVSWVESKIENTLENQNLGIYSQTKDGVVQIGLGDEYGFVESTLDVKGGTGISVESQGGTQVTIVLGEHSSESNTFGSASTSKYGHVKILDEFEKDVFGDIIPPVKQNGVAASPTLVYETVKNAIEVVGTDTWRPVEAVTEETMEEEQQIQQIYNAEDTIENNTLKFGPGLLYKDGIIDICWAELLGNKFNYKN